MKNTYLIFIACLICSAHLFAQTGSTASACPGDTWIKTLGKPGTHERGLVLCPAGDGNLYVTGSKPDSAILLKVSPKGETIWARSFDFFPGYDIITSLNLDSDGMLLGCAHSCTCFNGVQNAFFFKYDPQQDTILWAQRPGFFSTYAGLISGIREKHPGGNYYISYFSNFPPQEAVIMEINRHTGLEIPGTSWRYAWNGAGYHFHAFVVHGPFIYTIDEVSVALGSRQGLVCIDTSNGQPKWWQTSYLPQTDTAFFDGEDLIIDNDTLVSLLYGNDTGFDQLNVFAFLQKTTLGGELVWVKKYDIPALIGVRASELIRVNDGYVIFGSSASSPSLKDGLFLLKTDLDGNALWARLFDYSTNDWIYRVGKGGELIEMDDFLYFTAFTGDAAGTTDLLLAKIDPDGLAGDSCSYFMPTPVETYTITNPVQEKSPFSFRNEAIDFITAVPANKTGVADIPGFETICERICEPEEGCDVKINGCVKFELLSIALDDAGDRHYRVRFTNSCAGQELNYIAIQLPKGTVAVAPGEGTVYTSEGGRPYEVRNPNASPFYSIRFTPSGPGLAVGESDVFEYVLVGQAQPDYINVFARLWPGPSYEAHLNVFNCPVQMQAVQNRDVASGLVEIIPNPATSRLNVGLPGAGSGHWQLFSPEGRLLRSGKWNDAAGFTIEVADQHPGVYFVRICRDGEVAIDRRFVKI